MELRGDRVVLRPLAEEHVAPLAEIGAEPEVARWWPGLDEAELRRMLAGDGDAVVFAVEADGRVVGLIQYYEEDDPEYRHAGMDVSLSAVVHDRGLGTDAVRTMARHLVRDRGHHRLVIDPSAENARAIRCYEKVGFRPIGVARQYWRDGEGRLRDGLLMDLLASELDD